MPNSKPDFVQQPEMADFFEESFIEIIQRLADENKFKKGDFAERVWPESTPQVARARWVSMRNGDPKTGKPTSCSLRDAFKMAKMLGFQVAYLVMQAEGLAEQKFKQMMESSDTPSELKTPKEKPPTKKRPIKSSK